MSVLFPASVQLHFGKLQLLQHKFVLSTNKRHLGERRIGLYDTACAVRRLKNTASDKDLEVVEATDLKSMLRSLPECRAVAVTGRKG